MPRRGAEVRARERTPLAALPIEAVDVHDDRPAGQPRERGVMSHADVHEEPDVERRVASACATASPVEATAEKFFPPGDGM